MSKAFTSEEAEDASVAGRVPAVARPGEERPITAEGLQALLDERQRLSTKELPAARATTTGADPRALEHRIALLDAIVASVKVVPASRDGRVRFGSTVHLAWDDGREQVVKVVGPDEADPKRGRVSVESPLARALLGKAPGDAVELRLPRGEQAGEITAVS